MRIRLLYDRLPPHTVGGAERWYANLAERLVADGHEVAYVTLRQIVLQSYAPSRGAPSAHDLDPVERASA
jgi:hypothetical protein